MLESVFVTTMIGVAGACGALSRYLLSRFVAEHLRSRFPLGTLFINVSGAFLIGVVFMTTSRHLLSPTLQAVLATGFLGGYTTFSTMSWEIIQLVRSSQARASFMYIGSTVVPGLVAVVLGFALGRVI